MLWNPTQAKFELMELSQRKEKLHARLQVCVVLRELLHKDSFTNIRSSLACRQTCMQTYKR